MKNEISISEEKERLLRSEINTMRNEVQDFKKQNTSMQQTTIIQNDQIKKYQKELNK